MKQKELWSGSVWPTPVGLPIVVRSVEHAYREKHLDPRHVNTPPCWTLDYFFTPVRVWTEVERRWNHRPPFVAHLYPAVFRYREDSRPTGILPHHAWIRFEVEDPAVLLRMPGRRSGFAQFLDPDHVLGDRITEMAGFAAVHRQKAYWSVAAMARDLVRELEQAVRLEEGIYEVRPSVLTAGHDAVVDRALAYLSGHLSDPVCVEDVARALRMSPHTLAHRFTRVRGEGVMEALRRLRLLRAKPMLLAGHKLDAIAAETGFCDGRHLAKAFRKAEGLSPSAFLRQMAEKKPAGQWRM